MVDRDDIRRLMARAWDVPLETIRDDIEFNSHLSWDSMGHVSLMVALQEAYGVAVDFDMLVELTSLDAIVRYLDASACAE